MQELHDECGIAAIYHLESPAASKLVARDGPEHVTRLMARMLLDLQNRGQLAAGMTSFNPHREKVLDTYKQIGTVIVGQRYLIDRLLIGLLANGHVLLEGVPGLAKTLAVKSGVASCERFPRRTNSSAAP